MGRIQRILYYHVLILALDCQSHIRPGLEQRVLGYAPSLAPAYPSTSRPRHTLCIQPGCSTLDRALQQMYPTHHLSRAAVAGTPLSISSPILSLLRYAVVFSWWCSRSTDILAALFNILLRLLSMDAWLLPSSCRGILFPSPENKRRIRTKSKTCRHQARASTARHRIF